MDIIDRVMLAFSPTVTPWHDDARRIGRARKAITTALAKLAAAEAARRKPVEVDAEPAFADKPIDRKLGGFEKGYYMAPDFDAPLPDFAEYM